MSDGPLPTFIVVGAMKCGTTSLHEYLDAHPDICMSTPKETNFFLEDNDKDLDWYRERFPVQAQEYGETSTNYTKYPAFDGVSARMYQLLPDVKLLYLVRDPVERAVSHYFHNRIHDREAQSVDDAFLPPSDSHYLQTSRYHMQIARYLQYYRPSQLLVVESERLREERVEAMRRIFQFLGVAAEIDDTKLQHEYHATTEKLPPVISGFLQETRVGQTVKSVAQRLLPQTLIRRSLEIFREKRERPTLDETTAKRIRDYLKGDVRQLRELTGKSFASWSL